MSLIFSIGTTAELPPPPMARGGDFLRGAEHLTAAIPVSETDTREPAKSPMQMRAASKDEGLGRFKLLQKWEGVVLYADEDTFTARLFDSTGNLEPHEATFSRDELLPGEQPLIAAGAPFFWTIGYRDVGSTRHRDSTIYFRRLPALTDEELTSAQGRTVRFAEADCPAVA